MQSSPANELKLMQNAQSSRSVRSNECTVYTTKDDPDGERITLIIHVPSTKGGESLIFELGGIHVSATPQQLDYVISGALLAAKRFDNEQMCRKPIIETWLSASPETKTQIEIQSILQEADTIIKEEEQYRAKKELENSSCFSLEHSLRPWINANKGGIVQPRSLKQWHPNACGYHALYNAYLMLYAIEDGQENAIEPDETDFWAFVFRALAKLKSHRDRTGLWSTSRLERATLDENHLRFLVTCDPLLRGLVSIVDYEEGLPVLISHNIGISSRHSFVLACSSHWISGATAGNKLFLIMDSHNKPLASLETSEMCLMIATRTIEDYRKVFRAKMKDVHRYEHYPDDVLDKMYDDGVPEYWRGTVKDKMWWLHRPARVRMEILFRELETARDYLNGVRKVLFPEASLRQETNEWILPRRIARYPYQTSPGVYANLTSEHPFLAGFVRRDEALVKGDPGYDPTAPATIFNRKRPPPPEIKGDAFDRQRVIPGFDQAAIERQSCLVVGTGGIGMNVALSLARLGVGRICMVDYDTYDASNLTRQCLGTRTDVGLKKTDVALKNIQAHNLRTKVQILEADIIKDWGKVVSAARDCTVIFNCCDAGLMLDFALNSLSKELNIPLCCGQSFGWKYMSEFYSGECELNCAFCTETTRTTFSCHATDAIWERLTQHQEFSCELLKRPNATKYVEFLDQFFMTDDSFRLIKGAFQEVLQDSADKFILPTTSSEFNHFVIEFHDQVIRRMLPGKISQQSHLGFAARPKTPSTRYVGSWVCPCLACGVTCVSHWCLYLTGPDPARRNPPTTVLFNMDEGMTADEQMAYECGISLNRENRSFARSPSNSACIVCQESQRLREWEELYFGRDFTYLRPVTGIGEQVSIRPKWVANISKEVYEEGRGRILNRKRMELSSSPRILLPKVPAIDPIVSDAADDDSLQENPVWPVSLLGITPLIKTTKEDALDWPGSVKATASGVRSAVVVMSRGAKSFRLKGCGNNTDAFPLEVKGEDNASWSLRGCQFEHTAARELFMTEYINAWCGVHCGNVPIGFYRYPLDMPSTRNVGWRWEATNIEKYCTIFQTSGEKRLGDNLLNGLERIIRKLPFSQDTVKDVQDYLRMNGRYLGSSDELCNTATQVECGGIVLDCTRLSNLRSDYNDLRNLTDSLGRHKQIWASCIQQLLAVDTSPFHFLLRVAQRLGWECGDTMSKLESGGVSWGTFPDEMGIHCNAHANNFVVDAWSTSFLLAAVDFDMAFTAETYVEGCWVGKNAFFPKDFAGIVKFEQTMGMQTSLAGSDFTSTGCANNVMFADGADGKFLNILLRDTVVAGYNEGLRQFRPPGLISAETEDMKHAKALVTLGLIANELQL